MKSKTNFSLAIVAIALPFAFSGCSKKDEANPTQQSVNENATLQVVNGRIVFKDQAAFDQTYKTLEQIDLKSDKNGFNSWERNLNFSSLRTAARREENHLEELDAQHVSAPAHALMVRFGFPNTYAEFLNPAGEYQIGQKLFWFHDGFKYQATSEDELAAIKQNPSIAKIKTKAGSYIVKSGVINKQSPSNDLLYHTNTTVASSPYADGKYVYPFYLNNDIRSKRRTIYDIQVFTDDHGTDNGDHPYFRHFNTAIRLQIKFEYYNTYNQAWYPAQGQTFIYQIRTTFSGTPSVPDQAQPISAQTFSTNESFSTGDGYYSTLLGSADIYANVGMQEHTASEVQWTFDLKGGITGYPQVNIDNTYTIGSMTNYYTSLY